MQSLRALPSELLSLVSRPAATTPTFTRLTAPLARRTYFTSSNRSPDGSQPPSTRSWLPVPFVTESIGGQHHTTDLFSRLLKERIVAIYGYAWAATLLLPVNGKHLHRTARSKSAWQLQ